MDYHRNTTFCVRGDFYESRVESYDYEKVKSGEMLNNYNESRVELRTET